MEDELRLSQKKLENTVQDRTRELTEANTDLELEITERKRAEEALQKTRAELAYAARMTTVVELATSIADELNQPLGAIVNNGNAGLRLIGAPGWLPDDLGEILLDIVEDANRIRAIVARLRAMINRTTFEKTLLQFRDVVADVMLLAQRELAEHRIQVRTELPEDLPSVSGDRIQLQQVLLNLLMNGIDAMSELDEAQRILTIRGTCDDLAGQPAVVIAVGDLGRGFSREDCERLFDAFYTTKPEGMGVGLRISRSIIEAHGGRLWSQLNENIGASFLFSLPAEMPQPL